MTTKPPLSTTIDAVPPWNHLDGTVQEQHRPGVVHFAVDGLSCAADAVRLEHRLRHHPGVRDVTVNLVTEMAYITFDPELTYPPMLRESIETEGFRAWET